MIDLRKIKNILLLALLLGFVVLMTERCTYDKLPEPTPTIVCDTLDSCGVSNLCDTIVVCETVCDTLFLKCNTLTVILIKDNEYDPDSVTVNAGDPILFKLDGVDVHPTVSDDGAWTQFRLSSTEPTKTIILNSVGEYPYYCEAHNFLGMSGIIIVK